MVIDFTKISDTELMDFIKDINELSTPNPVSKKLLEAAKSEHSRRLSDAKNALWEARMNIQYRVNAVLFLEGRPTNTITGRDGDVK